MFSEKIWDESKPTGCVGSNAAASTFRQYPQSTFLPHAADTGRRTLWCLHFKYFHRWLKYFYGPSCYFLKFSTMSFEDNSFVL